MLPFIGGLGAGGGMKIARSLRFRSGNLNYLNRTLVAPTDGKKFTLSFWVKRCGFGTAQWIFSGGATNSMLGFSAADKLQIAYTDSGAEGPTTSGVFRDPSVWLHVVLVGDTTDATNTNRAKIYVNNVLQAVTFSGTITLNSVWGWNSAVVCNIGRYLTGASSYLDGYISDLYHVDGQALDPTSFGQTDATTGAWVPMAYAGTYGANGFYLKFADNSSVANLGTDSSGNGNTWTVNAFSVTAGVTNDSLTDTPTNYGTGTAGGDVRGNFCTWNPIWAAAAAPTNGNLDSPSAGVARGTQNALALNSYWELTSTGGISTAGVVSDTGTTNTTTVANGKTYGFRLTTAGALDYINITDAGSWTSITTGLTGVQYPYTSGAASTVATLNAGQRAFAGSVPSTYNSLCTQNLPDPAILKPSQYMDVNLRAGTGSAGSVSGKGFQPDLVWSKSRSVRSHMIADSVGGTTKYWSSDGSAAEVTDAQSVTAFNSDGFSFGTAAILNTNAENFADWLWKKGATPGVDIVAVPTTNTDTSHSLGVKPEMIIAHYPAGAGTRAVTHKSLGANMMDYYLSMENTAASTNSAAIWSAEPTSTVFRVGSGFYGAVATRAFLFASVAGFSKIDKYTGNGSADGPFVWCGFKPRWVMVKRSDAGTNNWNIFDGGRDTYNPASTYLLANASSADQTLAALDFNSNGFKLRNSTAGYVNDNAGTFIFAAFAEMPFKFSSPGR